MKWYKLFADEDQLNVALGDQGRRMLRIGERRLCLVKNDALYYAFDNLCPHNKHSLLEGKVNYLGEVICPLHGYRYSLKDGLECEGRSGALAVHEIEIRANGIFLGINE